ncbi:MAG: hypothetical protein KIS85_07495 [Anaerolineales bacterium]|nr:hypothetical protein [Anaerolineales bacterium]
MKIVWPWNRKRMERELQSVESLLTEAFKPVHARPSFVNDLRKRLVGSRNPLARAGLSTLELILIIGGAIVGVVVLVLTILGRFGGLVGKLKFWEWGKKKKAKSDSG